MYPETSPGHTMRPDPNPSLTEHQADRPEATQPAAVEAARRLDAQARRLNTAAAVVLLPVAVIGAVLSFRSLYAAATTTFGPYLAAGFPLLVDLLILGASLRYVAGAKVGRARAGWRLTAHAGVAGTLILNALAAKHLGEVPWHVTAPAVWSVLVEMTAREVLGEYKATHEAPADRIPLRLWLTAPVESARTWLRMARVGAKAHAAARVDVGIHAAANEALRLALPRWRDRRVRKILRRQLRAGSLPPAAVLGPLGWTDTQSEIAHPTGSTVLRAALRDVLVPLGTTVAADAAPTAEPRVDRDSSVTSAPPEEDEGRLEAHTPAEGVPELHALNGDGGRQRTATAHRLSDAVAVLRRKGNLTAPELRVALAEGGWELSERTAGRVLQDAKQQLDRTRLAAFQ